ncbi:VOC family protein [Ornithinimicrobium cavernae]|uniref:VOC family protein n=1 Tax=Ornithinimicrobium cavernae TaxID=2666047 RepID=UPI00192A3AA4|nr:VOC family protein [Ornithinimicrobium cavernae]
MSTGTSPHTRSRTHTDYQPEGYTTLTPFVVVSPAADAITFYQDVFGARTTSRIDSPDGTVLHAELQVGDGRLQLMDPNDQYHSVANDPTSDESRFSIAIYVPDVDATVALAHERGARVREAPVDFEVTGDRFGSIQDPFGVRWTVMCRTEHRTDEQVQQALDAWAATMG